MSPGRQAAIAGEIEFMKQSANRLKIVLDERPLGIMIRRVTTRLAIMTHLMMSHTPNNGFWQSICDFFANVWGGIKSTFQDSFNWVISQLVNICKTLGDFVHCIEELIGDLISSLQQIIKREGYSMFSLLVHHSQYWGTPANESSRLGFACCDDRRNGTRLIRVT
ncbi:hypothetical protein BJX66DRAFT_320544 [Aspergillus keveii]|uniref:Uncharacterized protein n=1 Tax=Aspergillus keveii TaxID=714993 RepID=A0ABR4FH02_9EURO